MHRLRELAERWFKVENKRYVPSHNGQTKRMPRTDEQKSIERDMWMVLLSSSLYLAVATSSDMNRERLEFKAEKWVEVYQEGNARGSGVFGIVEGISGNERFLRAHDGYLERWIMEAVGWWVSGGDKASHEEREIVTGALYKWKRELLEMYGQWLVSLRLPLVRFDQSWILTFSAPSAQGVYAGPLDLSTLPVVLKPDPILPFLVSSLPFPFSPLLPLSPFAVYIRCLDSFC